MQYDILKTFVAIAKTKSITKSASILNVTQSTVSHRLNLLEDEIGGTLVLRSKGKKIATLTQRGEAFVSIAQKWLDLWEETQLFCNSDVQTKIRFGCVNSLVVCLLRRFISDFYANYPKINLEVQVLDTESIYEKIKRGALDIGIVLANLPYQEANIRPLLSEKMFCVYSKDIEYKEHELSQSHLNTNNEVFLNWGIEFNLWHSFWFGSDSVPRLQVNQIGLIEDALKKGNHWAIVPETVANYFLNNNICKMKPLKNPPPERICYVISPIIKDPNKSETISFLEKELDDYVASYKNNLLTT